MTPPAAPVPVQAVQVGSLEVEVTFDRDVEVIASSALPWSIASDTGAPVATVFLTGRDTVLLETAGPMLAESVSYAPPPFDVVGDPDGVAVEAFSEFPVVGISE